MNQHLTTREAAAYLRVSLRTVFRLIAAGKLHPINVSQRRILIAKDELDEILQPKGTK